MSQANHQSVFTEALSAPQRRLLGALISFWMLGSVAFWHWSIRPTVWVTQTGTLINLILLFYTTGIPAWPFYLLFRMQQVKPELPIPEPLRVAMIVTKAPSEPWPLVQNTLMAMLHQPPMHDTWLADEAPSDEVRQWCRQSGVQLSSREHAQGYHRSCWPRRRRCKEGNLAYFYDQHGYERYDIVVQLDADHVPTEGYLLAMLQPFNDPKIGYVAAPSICNRNAAQSWVARGRLFAEAMLHGPMQLGCNHGFAPLCIGSHYAVRTKALRSTGGLGPELAEDHSTTLLLNAKGWKGAFAHRAICHGLGPETFEDAMIQEFQWARSLTIILLRHLPSCFRSLPLPLKIQFLYAQIFYPLRGTLTLSGLALPIIALATDSPWMRVNYPNFLVLSALQTLLTVLPVLEVRSRGLLRPTTAPIASWEQILFELSRGPWILAGVICAIGDWIHPQPIQFKITKKHGTTAPLPIHFLLPYQGSALLALTSVMTFADVTQSARGYVLLTLLSAIIFSATAMAIALLSHHQTEQPFRLHGFQICGSAGILMASIITALSRWQDLIQVF